MRMLRPNGLLPVLGSPNMTRAATSKFQIFSSFSKIHFWKNVSVKGMGQLNSFRASAPSADKQRKAFSTKLIGHAWMGDVFLRISLVCQANCCKSLPLRGAFFRRKSKPRSISHHHPGPQRPCAWIGPRARPWSSQSIETVAHPCFVSSTAGFSCLSEASAPWS